MSGRFSKIKWGDGLTVTDEGQGVIRVDGGGGSAGTGGHTIQDEGVALPTQPALNFAGAGVTATDDPANGRTLVTIPGGGGTPPDATTSSKGVVQLAGDLAGTAVSPQIAAGVIVNADVAAAAAIGVTKLAPGTNGQVLTTVSGAPAWAAAPAAPTVGYGTTLPASPVDGQEYILVDSTTTPSLSISSWQWRFRYNAGSSSAYKWECVGGPPLTGWFAGSTALTTSWLSYTPILTVPRAGEYLVTAAAANCSNPSGGGNPFVALGVWATDTGAVVAQSEAYINLAAGLNHGIETLAVPITATAGGQLAVAAYCSAVGPSIAYRRLVVTPIRVA